jgi:toluene monooxygenase electron transfer component
MKITVDSMEGQFAFDCAPTERILYAALRSGLSVPYECATGTCGTCRGRLTAGSADIAWDAAPGFARLKREKGDILMCQARPTGDCVLRVPARVALTPDGPSLPRHRRGRIAEARRLTHDVMQFAVVVAQPMPFASGQFVVLETPAVSGGRAYSMVNFAGAADRLTLLIKHKPGGRFSEWLFCDAAVGSELEVFGPLGRATFHPVERRDILCIAGGSGIAGMLSILEHARLSGHFRDHRGNVFFGVRTLADAFYLAELSQHAAATGGNLEITLALSHEEPTGEAHPQFPRIRLGKGLVADVAARAMAARYEGIVAFLAGPTPMVDAALHLLLREGRVSRQFVRYDKFS